MPLANGNSQKSKNLIQILLLVAAALYIVIADITVPLIHHSTNGGGELITNSAVVERLVRVEECTKRLVTIPESVAVLIQVTADLKTSVDELKTELRNHIEKGK